MEKRPTPMIAESAVPAAMVRLVKKCSGTMGSGARLSMRKKATKAAALTANAAAAPELRSAAHVAASTRATRAAVKIAAPATSKCLGAGPGSRCGTAVTARLRAAAPTGMLIQKTHCQPQ
jgi:hypothetical protein